MRSRCRYKIAHIWTQSKSHRTHRTISVPHSSTHQLCGSGVSCWWSAREKPKKVPRSPNLCRVWVVSRLKPHTWLKRANSTQRRVVQRWEKQGERETVFPCPIRAAIAGCRSFSRASSVQEENRGDSFYGSQRAKTEQTRANPVDVSSSFLPSVDASLVSNPLSLPPSPCPGGSRSACCCQSEEQAVKMWRLLVCVSVFLSMHVRLPLLCAQRETEDKCLE